MTDTLLFLLFLFGIAAMVRTSGWIVPLLEWMARYLKLSEYSVAFLLMAAATSIPELFIGVSSAASGIPGLSLGNILGANLLNVTLIIGLIAILRAVTLKDERITHGASFIFTLTATPLILLLDGTLSRGDGAILIFLFVAYMRYLFVASRLPNSAINTIEPTPASFKEFVRKLFLFLGGVLLLLIASRIVVYAAEIGALRLGVPPFLIGLMVISLGTTLPELTFGIRSVFAGKGGMSLGNAIGSVIFNLLFVLGLVALIHPITLAEKSTVTFINLLVVTAVILMLHITLRIAGGVPRGMGVALILVYVITAAIVWRLSFG